MVSSAQQNHAVTERLTDKARNERQKAMLLTEVARTRVEDRAKKLCEESARIVAQSKELCSQAKKLMFSRKHT